MLRLQRFEGADASRSGEAGPGTLSGEALDAMEELVLELPGTVAWTELSYQERQSGNQAPWLYALSALVVLVAGRPGESWSVPMAVIPPCRLACLARWLRR